MPFFFFLKHSFIYLTDNYVLFSVSFPALEKVDSSLEIFTDPFTEVVNDRTDAVYIDLPVLVSVRDLVVNGHVRRFVCPNHTTKYFYFY